MSNIIDGKQVAANIRAELKAEVAALKEKNIFGGIHYPVPIHKQLVYQTEDFANTPFPVSEAVAGQIFSLPVFPEMTEEEARYVAENLLTIIEAMA